MSVNWAQIEAVLEAERADIVVGKLRDKDGRHCSIGALAEAVDALGYDRQCTLSAVVRYSLTSLEEARLFEEYGIPQSWLETLYSASDNGGGNGASVDEFLAALHDLDGSTVWPVLLHKVLP